MASGEFPRAGQEQCAGDYSQLDRRRRRPETISAVKNRNRRDDHREKNRCAGRPKKSPRDKAQSAAEFRQHREETPETRREIETDQPVERAAKSVPKSAAADDFWIAVHNDKHRPDTGAEKKKTGVEPVAELQLHCGQRTIVCRECLVSV